MGVGLNAQNYISAIQILQIVGKSTDGVYSSCLDLRAPDCLEFSLIVLYRSGLVHFIVAVAWSFARLFLFAWGTWNQTMRSRLT